MSNKVNNELIERARELREETTGMSWISKRFDELLEANDLDGLRDLIQKIEGDLAVESFYNSGILNRGHQSEDIY